MVLVPQWLRPGAARSLGNHEARIRALERRNAGEGWRFNFDNEGGWGYVQFNDSVDLDLLPDPLGVGGPVGGAIEDASGDGLVVGSTTLLTLKSNGTILVEAGVSPLEIIVNGKPFQFRDDGTIHGPVGGNVVFDL